MRKRKKVLVVDMDMQGNVSEPLSGSEANAFFGESVYEAMIDTEVRGKIREIRPNLHLLPSTNFLSLLSRWIHTGTYAILGR